MYKADKAHAAAKIVTVDLFEFASAPQYPGAVAIAFDFSVKTAIVLGVPAQIVEILVNVGGIGLDIGCGAPKFIKRHLSSELWKIIYRFPTYFYRAQFFHGRQPYCAVDHHHTSGMG